MRIPIENVTVKPVKSVAWENFLGSNIVFFEETDILYKNVQHRIVETFIEAGTVMKMVGFQGGYVQFLYEGYTYYIEPHRLRALLKQGYAKKHLDVKRPKWLKVIHCESEGVRTIRSNMRMAKTREARVREIIKEENKQVG